MKTTLLILLGILAFAGCGQYKGYTELEKDWIELGLPPNTTNVVVLGKGWVTFDFNGKHFLYRRTIYDRSASECITELR